MIKKIIKGVIFTPSFIFLAWVTLSYCEILAKNLSENPVYSFWNIFTLM